MQIHIFPDKTQQPHVTQLFNGRFKFLLSPFNISYPINPRGILIFPYPFIQSVSHFYSIIYNYCQIILNDNHQHSTRVHNFFIEIISFYSFCIYIKNTMTTYYAGIVTKERRAPKAFFQTKNIVNNDTAY
jgi:hypothetical protein